MLTSQGGLRLQRRAFAAQTTYPNLGGEARSRIGIALVRLDGLANRALRQLPPLRWHLGQDLNPVSHFWRVIALPGAPRQNLAESG